MGRRLRSQVCRDIIVCYASTEAGTAASARYDVIENIPEAVGFVVPDVELEIVDEAGAALPTGSEGLIRLRTPQLAIEHGRRHSPHLHLTARPVGSIRAISGASPRMASSA